MVRIEHSSDHSGIITIDVLKWPYIQPGIYQNIEYEDVFLLVSSIGPGRFVHIKGHEFETVRHNSWNGKYQTYYGTITFSNERP